MRCKCSIFSENCLVRSYIYLHVVPCFFFFSANSAAPSWLFPFAEATCAITRHSSFATIWRLKSFIFTKPKSVTPEFICVVPDYPDVSITIPWSSVPTIEDFTIKLKVPLASV